MTKKCSKNVPKCPQNSPKTSQKCSNNSKKKSFVFQKMSNLIKNMSGWSSSVILFNLLHAVASHKKTKHRKIQVLALLTTAKKK